jgi:hypothetical protein
VEAIHYDGLYSESLLFTNMVSVSREFKKIFPLCTDFNFLLGQLNAYHVLEGHFEGF